MGGGGQWEAERWHATFLPLTVHCSPFTLLYYMYARAREPNQWWGPLHCKNSLKVWQPLFCIVIKQAVALKKLQGKGFDEQARWSRKGVQQAGWQNKIRGRACAWRCARMLWFGKNRVRGFGQTHTSHILEAICCNLKRAPGLPCQVAE